jgi:hypothetical protein
MKMFEADTVIHTDLPHPRQMVHKIARSIGSGLNEYLLPACLIGVVVLAGTPALIATMSQHVKTSTVTTLGDVSKQGVSAELANEALDKISVSELPNAAPLSAQFLSGIDSLDGQLEGQQQFQKEAGQLIKDVETLGSAGALRQMSQQLLRQLEALPSTANLTSEQKQGLTNLANQVNRVAAIQALLEETAEESLGEKDYFKNTLKTFEGKAYSSAELIMLIGSSSESISGITEKAKPYFENQQASESTAESHEALKTYGLELAGIVEMYEKAKAQGAINDPKIKLLVTLYTQKAIYLSQYMAYTSSQIITSSVPPEQLSASLVSRMTEQQAQNIQAQGKRQIVNKVNESMDEVRESRILANQEGEEQDGNAGKGKRKALGLQKRSNENGKHERD